MASGGTPLPGPEVGSSAGSARSAVSAGQWRSARLGGIFHSEVRDVFHCCVRSTELGDDQPAIRHATAPCFSRAWLPAWGLHDVSSLSSLRIHLEAGRRYAQVDLKPFIALLRRPILGGLDLVLGSQELKRAAV